MKYSVSHWYLSFVFLFLLTAGGFVRAEEQDPYQRAMLILEAAEESDDESLQNKQVGEAIELLKSAVQLGNADAMVQLAFLYANGIGCSKNENAAYDLLKQAAAKKNGIASLNLGHLALKKKDFKSACEHYLNAMLADVPEAGYYFGQLCLSGLGTERDPVRAAKAFRTDALRGLAKAQNMLGVLYFKGMGVELNYKEAERLFNLAAEQNDSAAINNLGVIARLQNSKEGYELAFRRFQISAGLGFPAAFRNLSQAYLTGTGTAVDYQKACQFAEQGAEKGDSACLHLLGCIHLYGFGVEKNPEKAFPFYLRAAEKGYNLAMIQVAKMYREGSGVKADDAQAEIWQKKSEQTQIVSAGLSVPE